MFIVAPLYIIQSALYRTPRMGEDIDYTYNVSNSIEGGR